MVGLLQRKRDTVDVVGGGDGKGFFFFFFCGLWWWVDVAGGGSGGLLLVMAWVAGLWWLWHGWWDEKERKTEGERGRIKNKE